MTSTSRLVRRTLPAIALLGVAGLATACGPDNTTGSGAASPTGGTTASSAPASTAPSTPADDTPPGTGASPTTAPTATGGTGSHGSPSASSGKSGGGPAPCASRDLQVTAGASQGIAGSTVTALNFKNISGKVCTLYGFPGVSQAGGTPVDQIGAAADKNTASPKTVVTLIPNAHAHALLRTAEAGNFSDSSCHPKTAKDLQVYPPNQTTPIYVAHTSLACASSSVKLLTVTTVLPGFGTADSN